jgi:hypothetical protein
MRAHSFIFLFVCSFLFVCVHLFLCVCSLFLFVCSLFLFVCSLFLFVCSLFLCMCSLFASTDFQSVAAMSGPRSITGDDILMTYRCNALRA